MSREVPGEWEIYRIADVASVKGGKRMPAGRPFADGKTNYPYIRVSDFSNGSIDRAGIVYVLPNDQKLISRYTISSRDVYISIAGTIGVCGMIPPDLDGAQLTENAAKIAVHSEAQLIPEFLKLLMSSDVVQRQISAAKGVGGGVPKLALFRIEGMTIPVPPLHEQRRIAEILSSVDDAIAVTRAVIEQTRKVKQGVLQRLLTKGIGHTRFTQTEIGEIPEGWEVGPLSRFGKVYTGKTPNTSDDEAWGGDTPFVTPGDLSDDRAIIGDSSRYVSEQGARQGRVMPAGAVAVTCIGSTIGKTGILNEPSMTNQQINTICCREEVSLFVYETCISLRSHLQRISGKQAVPIVNKSTFENIVVAHPKLEEQIEISRVALEFEKNLQTQLNNLKRLSLLKTALISDLLTGRKRVTDALPMAAE